MRTEEKVRIVLYCTIEHGLYSVGAIEEMISPSFDSVSQAEKYIESFVIEPGKHFKIPYGQYCQYSFESEENY